MSAVIQTSTGGTYDALNPRLADVKIRDIAHALSMLCRFGGHCSRFYSVAEHSVLVSLVVPPELALVGLMHDATEAYCVDVPRPLKRHLLNYAEIEHNHWRVIAEKFGMPEEMDHRVHDADNRVLIAERNVLLPGPYGAAWPDVEAAEVKPIGLSPMAAYSDFMARFRELTE